MSEPAKLLRLHARDNVGVLAGDATKDQPVVCGQARLSTPKDLTMGQKIALEHIPAGSDILKYGCPIGYAATDIRPGDHVHLHNVTSRYTVIEDMEAGQT